MILLSGELASRGELLTERPGDGWTYLHADGSTPRVSIRFGGRGRRADATYDLSIHRQANGVRVRLTKRVRPGLFGTPATDPDAYDVHLPDRIDLPVVCTCAGYQFHGRCKHAAAVRALRESECDLFPPEEAPCPV